MTGVESAHPHSIFRESALRRYARQSELDVVPHLVEPRVFRLCWLLLTALAAGSVMLGVAIAQNLGAG